MVGGVPLWIPIVGAIGSLGVGAFVGAVAAHLLRERVDRKQQHRERDGLLRLVLIEMRANEYHLNIFEVDPEYVAQGLLGTIGTDAWEAVRVRLAQLLPSDDFENLAEYYEAQQGVTQIVRNAGSSSEQEAREEWHKAGAHQWSLAKGDLERALDVIEHYLGEIDRDEQVPAGYALPPSF